MKDLETPRKVSVEQVEVLSSEGAHVSGAPSGKAASPFGGIGGIRVFQGGPAMLLLLPIVIPFLILGLLFMTLIAIITGKAVVRTFKWKN